MISKEKVSGWIENHTGLITLITGRICIIIGLAGLVITTTLTWRSIGEMVVVILFFGGGILAISLVITIKSTIHLIRKPLKDEIEKLKSNLQRLGDGSIFSYTDLKTFGGIDIEGIASRLQEAQKWFQQTYPGADPFEWFPRIRLRSKVIRNHLSRIKANESLADQALLIFEAQVDFIVCLKDILIDELIHKVGWIQRSKDGNRQKIENRTNNFSEAEITNHHTTAQVLLDLCRDERKWVFLTEEEKKRLSNNKLIQNLREPKQYLKAVLTKKVISYIRKGKITFAHSVNFEKMTDGMFEMEYDELTYRTRLYEAIGFLGRNLRFSDSPSFCRNPRTLPHHWLRRRKSDFTLSHPGVF